jgi:hypothetical protein
MKITLGYDILTHNGFIPNCLDPKFLETIREASDYDYGNCRDYFIQKWGCDYPVFNGHDLNSISVKKSVFNIVEDRKMGINYKWFYIIEPHSGFDLFFGNHPLHNEFLMKFISKTAINEIVNNNGNLLINYVIDGGLGITKENFDKIIKFTKTNNIPDEKVYLIFSDFKLKENFKKLNVNYKVFDHNFYLKYKSHEFNKIIKESDINKSTIASKHDFISKIGSDKKDFLLLTRHFKLHRIALLSQLHKLGIDNSLVSWEKTYYNHSVVEQLLKFDNNDEFIELIKNTSKTIDVDDLTNIMGIGFENKDMYLNTYLSIVTESIFFQNDIDFPSGFLSEKIWKPIGHCQPFILAGPSRSLNYIKERYGFKTFHPFIDETYDTVDDDYLRLNLIKNEIIKFSQKTKEEKKEFLNNVKNICFFNQELFLKINNNSFGEIKPNVDTNKILKFLFNDINNII